MKKVEIASTRKKQTHERSNTRTHVRLNYTFKLMIKRFTKEYYRKNGGIYYYFLIKIKSPPSSPTF